MKSMFLVAILLLSHGYTSWRAKDKTLRALLVPVSTDLELVEIKQRNLIDECGEGFLHFNFVVKEIDGKLTNFFAEVHPDLKDEKHVYLCVPLDEKDLHPSEGLDQAHCYGCKDRAKDLVHPCGGGFLGGHKDVGFPFMELESDDESDE